MRSEWFVFFSHLPNQEELENNQRDEHGRFLYKHTSLYDLFSSDISQPISEKNGITKPLWPDNKSFALCLTHDVDHIKTYWKMTIRRLLERIFKRDFLRVIEGIKWYFAERFVPKSIFKHIIEIENKYDAI